MKLIKKFIRLESSAGILLGLAAMLAITLKNTSFSNTYDALLNLSIQIHFGNFHFSFSPLLFTNDFLMAIFFLLVGTEIKRELLEGKLSTKDQRILPAIAALGGMVVPAVIYLSFNKAAINGWAIPTATDIAFALGILALLGSRVSGNIKTCLLTLAILDDLAAVIMIAIFYTQNISSLWLIISLLPMLLLAILNVYRVRFLLPYLLTGMVLWICILNSGVHATLAGVILAFFIPLNTQGSSPHSPLKLLEVSIHPWVSYCILPLFAFANAGVYLMNISPEHFLQPITLGIFLGLFFGKQIGVMLFSAIGIMTNLCKLPNDVTWWQYYGMSLVTGIGFTMSLFIGMLAFKNTEQLTAVRLGVISGSFASGLMGYLVLKISCQKQTS